LYFNFVPAVNRRARRNNNREFLDKNHPYVKKKNEFMQKRINADPLS